MFLGGLLFGSYNGSAAAPVLGTELILTTESAYGDGVTHSGFTDDTLSSSGDGDTLGGRIG